MTDIMERMKRYERCWESILTPRMPVIMRVDGRCFSWYTKVCQRPFDHGIINAMWEVAKKLCKDIQGAQLAYVQSDEISILIHSYKTINSQAWFDNNVQKMVSLSAANASVTMTAESFLVFGKMKEAQFDSRVFTIPENDVCNYFLARQQDWQRNSVQMLASSLYSHNELHKKNNSELKEMIVQKGQNWGTLPTYLKLGACIIKQVIPITMGELKGKTWEGTPKYKKSWEIDKEIPIFSQDRSYIERCLK